MQISGVPYNLILRLSNSSKFCLSNSDLFECSIDYSATLDCSSTLDWAKDSSCLFPFSQRFLSVVAHCLVSKINFFLIFCLIFLLLRVEDKSRSYFSNMANSGNWSFLIFLFFCLIYFISLNIIIHFLLFVCNLRLNISFCHMLFLLSLSQDALFLCMFIFAQGQLIFFGILFVRTLRPGIKMVYFSICIYFYSMPGITTS